MKFGVAAHEGNIEQITIALAGIAYVAYAAARHFGFDLKRVVWAVHQANMSKRGPDGFLMTDEGGKVSRGKRYRPPDIAGALAVSKPSSR